MSVPSTGHNVMLAIAVTVLAAMIAVEVKDRIRQRRWRHAPQVSQPEGLIEVLLDETAPPGDRDEAATDLGEYDGEAVEAALAHVACDPSVDEDLADSCGESLAEIWCRKGQLDEAVLLRLTQASLPIALAMLRAGPPHLAAEVERLLGSGK